jgi:hypothetical protein
MDIEYGGNHDETARMGTNDAIEVVIPPRLKKLIEDINREKLKSEAEINKKKHKHKTVIPGGKDKAKEDLDYGIKKDLELVDNLIQKFYNEGPEQDSFGFIDADNQKMENEDERRLKNAVDTTIFNKNQDFHYTIMDEVTKLIRDSKYRYHILFIEFQSSNMTEMNECDFKYESSAGSPTYNERLPQQNLFHIRVVEVSDVDKIISDLEPILNTTFAEFEKKQVKGSIDEDQFIWIVIFFSSKFFLSELALEKLIKYIDELYYRPGFKFIFIFKKIEDATVFPAFNETIIKFVTYDKTQNLFFDFLLKWFEEGQGFKKGRILGREILANLIDHNTNYKNNIRSAVKLVNQMYSIHRAIYPGHTISDIVQRQIILRREYFLQSMTFLKSMIAPLQIEKDIKHYSEILVKIYSGTSGMEEVKIYHYLKALSDNPNDLCPENLLQVIEKIKILLDEAQEDDPDIKNPHSVTLKKKLEDVSKEIIEIREAKKENEAKNTKDLKKKKGNIGKVMDHKDRFTQLLAAKEDKFSKEEVDQYDIFLVRINTLVVEYVDQCISDYHMYLKKHASHLLMQNFDELVNIIQPDIQGEYMCELSKVYQQSGTAKMNPAELAIRVLFDVFANENYRFYVSKVKSQFEVKMNMMGLVRDPAEVKHLFYFSLNQLKRCGLIHEQNRVKQIVYKSFFSRTRLHQSQL